MGHDHDHHHGDRSQFYLEQIFTIAVCAAFGGVTLILWSSGTLNNMLAVKFHVWVMLGGAGLLAMAVINGVAVWFSVGDAKAVPVHDHDHDHHDHDHHHHDHDHHHDHAHAHAHEHAHAETAVQATPPTVTGAQQTAALDAAPAPDDGHGHDGHDHGWAPWRYAVLLLPVAIYFVVPLEALSAMGGKAIDVDVTAAAPGVEMKKDITDISFQALETAALDEQHRKFHEGETVRLVGQYVPKDDRMFTLRRFKISCCAADAVPLNAVILLDRNCTQSLDGDRLDGKWVQVTGVVQFLPRAGGNGFVTTLVLAPTADWPLRPTDDHPDALVKEVPPPANPYLN